MKPIPLSPLALHCAGATVRHEHPFSDLEVPVAYDDASAYCEHWMTPFIYGFSIRERQEALIENRSQVTPARIASLLKAFDWRPRKAGAHFAALTRDNSFTDQIGRLLLRSDLCYAAERYCLALAEFNTDEAISYLLFYLEYCLHRRDLPFDQGFVLSTVICLDRSNGTSLAEPYLLLWQEWYGTESIPKLLQTSEKVGQEISELAELR